MPRTIGAGVAGVEPFAGLTGRTAAAIAQSVEAAVRAGGLAPGSVLPPIRALAAELEVNVNTVAAAYRLARERGLVEAAGRAGTRVLARPATTTRQQLGPQPMPGVRDLSTGEPDPGLLPPVAVPAGPPVSYAEAGRSALHPGLEHAARAAFAADAVPVGPLACASGALDAMERVLLAHLRPGDRVAVEDPGWANCLDLLAATGLVADPVPVDDEGPVPEALGAALARGAKACIV